MKRIQSGLDREEIQQLLQENKDHRCEGIGKEGVCVRIISVADLPSIYGDFQVAAFVNSKDEKEHAAFIHGDILDQEAVPVRIHSECLTGDVMGSLRCDCHDQLVAALRMIGKMRRGVLLYLRQEGRGIGFANKIRAYALQEEGLDTTEANVALGFRDDEREYSAAAHMLRSLHVKSIRLMTNNPHKITEMEQYGIEVVERIPLVIPPNRHNRFYLETKEKKFGHMLQEGASHPGWEHFQEQMDVAVFRKR